MDEGVFPGHFPDAEDSTMVTMELSASGMAVTANATAKRKVFIPFSCRHSARMANGKIARMMIALFERVQTDLRLLFLGGGKNSLTNRDYCVY